MSIKNEKKTYDKTFINKNVIMILKKNENYYLFIF